MSEFLAGISGAFDVAGQEFSGCTFYPHRTNLRFHTIPTVYLLSHTHYPSPYNYFSHPPLLPTFSLLLFPLGFALVMSFVFCGSLSLSLPHPNISYFPTIFFLSLLPVPPPHTVLLFCCSSLFVVCLVFSCSPPSFLRRQLFLYFANLVLGAYVMSDFDPDPYIEQRLHSSVTWEMYPVPHGYPTGLCPLISIRTLLFHSPSYPLPHHACNSIYQSSKVKDIQFSKHTSACWCWRGVGRE